MKNTSTGVKFDSIEEAVNSLSEAGYKTVEVVHGIYYGVLPIEIEKNHPNIPNTTKPLAVAVLFKGIDLAYRNGSHDEVKRHHEKIKKFYSELSH